jgi:hypothetical protein
MDIKHGVELRFRGLGKRDHFTMSGIVDQVIDAVAAPDISQRCAHKVDEGRETSNVPSLKLQGDSLATKRLDFGNDSLCRIGACPVGQDDVAAVSGDTDGGIAAETSASAGDYGNGAH